MAYIASPLFRPHRTHGMQRCGMRAIVTDVPWSVYLSMCVCLLVVSVRAMSCAETAEPIEMSYWGVDSGGTKEPCVSGSPDPPGEGQFWWTFPGLCKYREYQACGQYLKIIR